VTRRSISTKRDGRYLRRPSLAPLSPLAEGRDEERACTPWPVTDVTPVTGVTPVTPQAPAPQRDTPAPTRNTPLAEGVTPVSPEKERDLDSVSDSVTSVTPCVLDTPLLGDEPADAIPADGDNNTGRTPTGFMAPLVDERAIAPLAAGDKNTIISMAGSLASSLAHPQARLLQKEGDKDAGVRAMARACAPPCPQCAQRTCVPYSVTGRVCMRCSYCERPSSPGSVRRPRAGHAHES
jgi:hypothetical protein